MRKMLYPGSFDPISFGHLDIIKRVSCHCDELTVLISQSVGKSYLFSLDERVNLIKKTLKEIKNVKVDFYNGITVNYAKENNIPVIVRGIRMASDFEYEMTLSQTNKKLNNEIETFTVFSNPEYLFISSSFIKDIAKNKGNLKEFVPNIVAQALHNKYF